MPRRAAIALFALWLAGTAAAQDSEGETPPALLVADRVFVSAERDLVAEGNVEAYQGDTRLTARRIVYDRETETLTIEGPIRIDDGETITLIADFAELDRGLQDGLLIGARLVLSRQLQLASLRMTRVEGRFSQLYKTAVTSCRVCDRGEPPLWQIRARKITHDQLERQLYFEEAQFLIYGLPVFYIPAMRLPDPSLERATGFLIPSVRSTSNLETGVKVPYFLRLGDHADLTLTPYLSPRTRTLEMRYRQAFRTGLIQLEGAYTRDDLFPGQGRGYAFGVGEFRLPRGYRMTFDIESVSDDAYLVDYGLPDLDRLQSELRIERYKARSAFRTRLIQFESLRDDDDEDLLPTLTFDSTLERRFFPATIGGEFRLGLGIHGHRRSSDLDILGRDLLRGTADVSWRRHWILPSGLRADWEMGAAADSFEIGQDSTYPDRVDRVTPRAAVRVSLPMAKTDSSGARQFLEPVLQIGWSDVGGGGVPNEESTFVEFDRGNLLALSRFPAEDRREDGAQLAYGLNWARFTPSGWEASASLGQVIRERRIDAFSATSGLSGATSDLLVAAQLRRPGSLSLTARALLDDFDSFSKAEFRGDWVTSRARLAGTYLWLGADPVEDRDGPLSEIWLDGAYEVSAGWTAAANLRYDITDTRATRAGLGLVYRNECVTVDLSVNRRYSTSNSVEPTTDFGFTISLNGFSVDGEGVRNGRSCE